MLTKYQLIVSDFYKFSIESIEKFVPNFFDKEKYVLYYENLQLYLRLGLKIKKNHRLLEFNQSQ